MQTHLPALAPDKSELRSSIPEIFKAHVHDGGIDELLAKCETQRNQKRKWRWRWLEMTPGAVRPCQMARDDAWSSEAMSDGSDDFKSVTHVNNDLGVQLLGCRFQLPLSGSGANPQLLLAVFALVRNGAGSSAETGLQPIELVLPAFAFTLLTPNDDINISSRKLMVILMASLTASEVLHCISELENTKQPTKPPLENFPVPRELRDHIYRFLLNPDEIRCEAKPSHRAFEHWQQNVKEYAAAPTYKYSTNILGTNRAIHDEATKYLYENSTFVRVQVTCIVLLQFYAVGVPFISLQQVHKFEQHSLDVLFGIFKGTDDISTYVYHNILMLAEDLPPLRDMMRFGASHCRPRVPYIISGRAPALDEEAGGLRLKVSLSYRVTKYKSLSRTEQNKYLEPFKTVTGAGYTLRISGFEDQRLAEVTQQVMAPMVVWLAAKEWNRVQAYWMLKRRADGFALSGRLEAARALYSFLIEYLAHPEINMTIDVTMRTDEDLILVRQLENNMAEELLISRGWLDQRFGDMAGVEEVCNSLARVPTSQLHPLFRFKCHLLAFGTIGCLGHLSIQARNLMSVLVEFWNTHPESQGDAYMHYDLALYRAALTEFEATGVWNLPREKLSASILPARIFDQCTGSQFPTPKGKLIGWQNKEELLALTDAQKEQILALHGQPWCEWATQLAKEGRWSFEDL